MAVLRRSGTFAAVPLTGPQRIVLETLKGAGRSTTEAVLRARTGIEHVDRILRELERFEPPLVEFDVDSKLETRVWIATLAAADLLDADAD